jgi:hypothetical protein
LNQGEARLPSGSCVGDLYRNAQQVRAFRCFDQFQFAFASVRERDHSCGKAAAGPVGCQPDKLPP